MEQFELGSHADDPSGLAPPVTSSASRWPPALLTSLNTVSRRATQRCGSAGAPGLLAPHYGTPRAGVTIIVTTHFMQEAEYCDRIATWMRAACWLKVLPEEIDICGPAGRA